MSRLSPRTMVIAGVLVAAGVTAWIAASQRASGPQWKVHVVIGVSQKTQPSFRETIEYVLALQEQEINETGGLAGRPVEILVHNDRSDGPDGVEPVELANTLSADPDTLVVTGLMSSMRANPAVPIYSAAGIPVLGGFSDSRELSKSPSTYSVGVGIEDESEYLEQFLLRGDERTLLLYRQKDDYTLFYVDKHGFTPIGPAVKAYHASQEPFVVTQRSGLEYPRKMEDFKASLDKDLRAVWANGAPERLILALGATRNAAVYDWVRGQGHDVEMFSLVGTITGSFTSKTESYPYGVTSTSLMIPKVTNIEIERYVNQHAAFFSADPGREKFAASSLVYADRINMVRQALALAPDGEDPRARVVAGLARIDGSQNIHYGRADLYALTPERFADRPYFLIENDPRVKSPVLVPDQHVKDFDGEWKVVPVAFINLDMIGINDIDTSAGEFGADFRLEVRSKDGIVFDDFEISNVVKGASNFKPLLSVQEILNRSQKDYLGRTWTTHLYQVNARLRFDPKLRAYPMDTQRLPLQLRPKNQLERPFFIQPLSEQDMEMGHEGWDMDLGFVGMEPFTVRLTNNDTGAPELVPVYRFSYAWELSRQARDFLLKIGIPLLIVLILAYAVLFLPRSEFEAACAISITALLSAIALYMGLPTPETPEITLADATFFFSYAVVSVCIIPILRDRILEVEGVSRLNRSLRWLVPVAVLVPGGYLMTLV